MSTFRPWLQALLAAFLVTALTACGDDNDSSGDAAAPTVATVYTTLTATTPYLLKSPVPSADPYANSIQQGDIYSFSGGGLFSYQWGLNQNQADATQRQAYGLQFGTADATTTSTDFFGLTFKVADNGVLDIAAASTLVIQLGNGSPLTGVNAVSSSKTHHVFTIVLNAGTQDSSTFAWSHVCEYDLTIADDTRPGGTAAKVNPYGINTYRIALSSINTCNFNSTDTAARATLESSVAEVAVKVVGGKDAVASNSTGTSTLLQVGWMGFEGDAASTTNTANFYKTFATGYEGIPGASAEPWDRTKEGGDLRGFSGGNFSVQWKVGQDGDHGYEQRNAYGIQYGASVATTGTDYFGYSIFAPNNSTINVAAASTLLIQMGNGSPLDGDNAVANTHLVYTMELGSGTQDPADGSRWTNHCVYSFRLDGATRPTVTASTAGVNNYGLHTYAIPLSNFVSSGSACERGTLVGMQAALASVSIKVVGGQDETASAQADTSTLLQVGWIAFE